MADNKYNQSLLDKGYTQDQIDTMVNAVSSWQDAMEVVKDMNQYKWQDNWVTVWPQNANVNYYQYWDDSNPAQQWQKGWMNEKYTGEWVSNTYIDYNPNLKTSDLDPNYYYWEAARQQNRKEAGYIARRNDNIASALYNEGLTSKEDVANWLSQQREWMNSTEADRANTIESVWKRIWQIKPKDEINDPEEIPEMNLNDDFSGELYWKVTANDWQPVKTLSDANSVYAKMNEARRENYTALSMMKAEDIATSIRSGTIPYGNQAYRDLQQFNPEKYQAVQEALKKQNWQEAVNAISKWDTSYTDKEVGAKNTTLETSKVTMAQSVSSSWEEAGQIVEDINSAMEWNVAASSAEQTMANIQSEMSKLNTRLKNLRSEANSAFKWDVPQYIVNAYIANRTQEINDRLTELKYDYNAAYERYQTELSNMWKQKEYDLQLQQLQMQKDQMDFNQWYQKQQLAKSNIVTDSNGKAWQLKTGADGSVYYEEITQVQQYAASGMKRKGLKNNNPWNIKDTTFGNVIGTDESWFARFATPEDWFDALVAKIQFNQTNPNSRYYGKTLREYFRIYAPSSDGNNPDAYAQSVAKQLWVSVDTPISQVDPVKLAAAIAKHDSGYDYSTYWQFRTGTTWTSGTGANFNIDDIEIPWSIFEDDTLWMTIDPKSDEWLKRIMEYLAPYVVQNVDVNNTSYSQWPLSDDWITPIAYRQRIYQLVPWQLKNNVAELENLYNTARALYQAGYTADQAALTFYWLDLKNDQTWMMQTLVDIARSAWVNLSDEFYGNLGSFTERWLNWYAISMIENEIIPNEQRKEISKYEWMLRKIQNVRDALNNMEKKATWPISWRLSELKNKWFKSDSDYQEVVTAIDIAFSQLRNSLLWSAITESEKTLYSNLFPEKTDFYDNILIKLQQSEDWLITDINAIRNAYWLPSVNLEQQLNPSLRYVLYKSMQDVFN